MTAALIKRILYYIATVTSVAIVFLASVLPQGAVFVLAAALLMNLSLETTLLKRSGMIAATAATGGVLLWLGCVLAPYFPAQLIFIALVTAVCAYTGTQNSRYAYPLFIVNFLALISLHSGEPALQTMLSVFAAAALVIAAQIVLLPFFNRDEYQRSIKRVLQRMSRLSTNIFTCMLSPDYADSVYLYERRVHKQKIKCLNQMHLLARRELAVRHAHIQVCGMQTLFEIILDLGQLRRRVTDHATFALCAKELRRLAVDINNLLTAMALNQRESLQLNLAALQRSIHEFEDTFEHVLKVAAPEPLVFILFTGALKALLGHCREMAGVAPAAQGLEA